MGDPPRKRADRTRYEAALASWRNAECPACHDAGTIQHDKGELPCPYCQPDEARAAAAREATP